MNCRRLGYTKSPTENLLPVLFFSTDQGQFRYSELPNETLFKLLTENMEKLNDREVLLTDEECRRFTCHVVGRERNGMALPFSEQVEFETDFATR